MQDPKCGDSRLLLFALRRALILALGALEDYLGVNRTVEPRRKRKGRREPTAH